MQISQCLIICQKTILLHIHDFKRFVQKKYDNELWMMAMNLITRCTNLYDFELNEEFMYLAEFRFNYDKDLDPILLRLAVFLKARERDLAGDNLITDLYKYLFEDYELEDEDQYRQYLEKYANYIEEDA